MRRNILLAMMLVGWSAGCGGAVIEPGHRGLLFDPRLGGLQRQVLEPGNHRVGLSGRIEDFDVTYSTHRETLQVTTAEGLAIKVGAAIIYRPIISELYELDTEIGSNYYDEVIGPEFRSAARACIARHFLRGAAQGQRDARGRRSSASLRERIAHASTSRYPRSTFEDIQMAPEIVATTARHGRWPS